ncbi:MAG: hypothetical protein A2Z69_03665 [Bacteroidetes bacterium RBG_13_44_24]|nr:MAG: hypothetical protein A2Z69_03665 [Bacteroidetes bacterium RBG_13_44_24]
MLTDVTLTPSTVSVTVLVFDFRRAFICCSDKLHVSIPTEKRSGVNELSFEVVLVVTTHLQQRSFSHECKDTATKNIRVKNTFFIKMQCIKLQKTIVHAK